MTAALSRDAVLKVAALARLELTDEELETFTGQLAAVLEYVDVLNELDTDGVEPMTHVAELTDVLRDDEPCASLPSDAALANAPKSDGRFFLVPPILDTA